MGAYEVAVQSKAPAFTIAGRPNAAGRLHSCKPASAGATCTVQAAITSYSHDVRLPITHCRCSQGSDQLHGLIMVVTIWLTDDAPQAPLQTETSLGLGRML